MKIRVVMTATREINLTPALYFAEVVPPFVTVRNDTIDAIQDDPEAFINGEGVIIEVQVEEIKD